MSRRPVKKFSEATTPLAGEIAILTAVKMENVVQQKEVKFAVTK